MTAPRAGDPVRLTQATLERLARSKGRERSPELVGQSEAGRPGRLTVRWPSGLVEELPITALERAT